jgi:hypothetical protein
MIIICYTKRVYYNKKEYIISILIRSGNIGMIPKKAKRGHLKDIFLQKVAMSGERSTRTKKKEGRKRSCGEWTQCNRGDLDRHSAAQSKPKDTTREDTKKREKRRDGQKYHYI